MPADGALAQLQEPPGWSRCPPHWLPAHWPSPNLPLSQKTGGPLRRKLCQSLSIGSGPVRTRLALTCVVETCKAGTSSNTAAQPQRHTATNSRSALSFRKDQAS